MMAKIHNFQSSMSTTSTVKVNNLENQKNQNEIDRYIEKRFQELKTALLIKLKSPESKKKVIKFLYK